MIRVKRIYDKPEKRDGFRIWVDRLWPRGISKENAKIDLWLRDIAPSDELRKWFSHDIKKLVGFQERNVIELKVKTSLINKIKQIEKDKKIIKLLFSAKEMLHNNATVLSDYLKNRPYNQS